ncbi:MAG: hypothetical protein WCC27_15135 [Acidobacteriaceae bacterium]
MSATVAAYRRPRELSASDGFGLLTPPPQPRRPEAHGFCLDATTHWRSATPSIASPPPAASTLPAKAGVPAAPEPRNIPL